MENNNLFAVVKGDDRYIFVVNGKYYISYLNFYGDEIEHKELGDNPELAYKWMRLSEPEQEDIEASKPYYESLMQFISNQKEEE